MTLDRRRRHLAVMEQPAGVQRQPLARTVRAGVRRQEERGRPQGDRQPGNQRRTPQHRPQHLVSM